MKIMKDMKKISPRSMNTSADLKKNKITMFGVGILPLCPAPSIGDAAGLKRADCLTPPQAGEFPRAPAVSTTRRVKRDAGVFFWFVFFHVEENEQSNQLGTNGKH